MKNSPEYQREYARVHKEKIKEYNRKYELAHKEQLKERRRIYCEVNKKHILERCRLYREANKERISKHNTERQLRLKIKVLGFYSGGQPICRLCGITDIDVLTLDHINGGGGKHRRTLLSENFYFWVVKNGFPSGFQTLCFNCNHKKYFISLHKEK